jgi:hypothetical protein
MTTINADAGLRAWRRRLPRHSLAADAVLPAPQLPETLTK